MRAEDAEKTVQPTSRQLTRNCQTFNRKERKTFHHREHRDSQRAHRGIGWLRGFFENWHSSRSKAWRKIVTATVGQEFEHNPNLLPQMTRRKNKTLTAE